MTPTTLLDALRTRGVLLAVEGDALTLDAPKGVLTNDVRQAVRQHKQELLALLTQAAPANVGPLATPYTQEVCAHQAYFPPTVTEGPTRQCRHCPHVWQVPCVCGAAAWIPMARRGADGAGTVLWTCRGCGAPYGVDQVQRQGQPVERDAIAPRSEALETPSAVWSCSYCHGPRRWRSVYGAVGCGTCHPPGDEKLVGEWVEAQG